MDEWKEYKLGEVCDVRDGTHDSPKECSYGKPLVTSKNIKNGRIDLVNTYLISDKDYDSVNRRSKVDVWDVLFSMIGTVGECAIVKDTVSFAIKNVGLFKTGGNELLAKWIYYYFQSNSAKAEIDAKIKGSTQQYIALGDLRSFPILFPPIEIQRYIIGILECIDDKIDLLHQENKTLEAMAETLFRKWFIEEAKEEWEEKDIYTYAEHYKVSIVPKKHPQMFFRHYSIPAFDNGKEASLEKGECIQSNKNIVPSNCILFSKLNPHKDKRVWLILDGIENNAICSTEFQIIKPKESDYLYFLYGWLTSKENYEEISSGVGGTSGSHQRIDSKSIFIFSCPNVDAEIIYSYNKMVEPLYYKQKLNQNQIINLKEQRNRLLRKFMLNQ